MRIRIQPTKMNADPDPKHWIFRTEGTIREKELNFSSEQKNLFGFFPFFGDFVFTAYDLQIYEAAQKNLSLCVSL